MSSNFLKVQIYVLTFVISSILADLTQDTINQLFTMTHGLLEQNGIEIPTLNHPGEIPENVNFRLYTKDDPQKYEILKHNNPKLLTQSSFNIKYPTRILIPGWISGPDSHMPAEIRSAYFQRGKFNIIVVDWTIVSYQEYSIAIKFLKNVGKVVADFIRLLHDILDVDIESIYLIGHSLGGHVVGFTGKHLSPCKVGTIFGLDVALPYFWLAKPEDRLSSEDAAYVETIHTNAGFFGFYFPLGHASFYPNYGAFQLGCETSDNIGCSHHNAVSYFAESITSRVGFYGIPCQNVFNLIFSHQCVPIGKSVRMGGEPSLAGRSGVFSLTTNSKSPFARGYKQ